MAATPDDSAAETEPIRKTYRFLTGPDDEHFCLRVSEARQGGWELYGSPTMAFNGETMIVGQAIVRPMYGPRTS